MRERAPGACSSEASCVYLQRQEPRLPIRPKRSCCRRYCISEPFIRASTVFMAPFVRTSKCRSNSSGTDRCLNLVFLTSMLDAAVSNHLASRSGCTVKAPTSPQNKTSRVHTPSTTGGDLTGSPLLWSQFSDGVACKSSSVSISRVVSYRGQQALLRPLEWQE